MRILTIYNSSLSLSPGVPPPIAIDIDMMSGRLEIVIRFYINLHPSRRTVPSMSVDERTGSITHGTLLYLMGNKFLATHTILEHR